MAVKTNSRIIGVKTTTLALYEGVFASVIGLGLAIFWSLSATFQYGAATDSVIQGLVFGFATGIISIVLVPLVYFAFGWLLGIIHGFIFNVISEASGGIVLRIENFKEDK